MTTIDTVAICALLDITANIAGTQIPGIYRRHGVGAEVERNVLTMLNAALDCLTRATELATAHEPTRAVLAEKTQLMRGYIADHEFELQAWLEVPILIAMDEAESATKH